MSDKKVGSITVLCGPMWSGKSEELLRRLRRYSLAGFPELLFTAGKGRNAGVIKCRGGDEREATVIRNATEIITEDFLKRGPTVVVFDEAQWLEGLRSAGEILTSCGHQVLIAGLDMDWQGAPFPSTAEALAVAENVVKLRAVCTQCGEDATHSARLGDGDDAGGKWEPMCRKHWNKFMA